VAKKSVNYWQTIAAATEGDKDYAGVHEAQLPEIFSTNPTDFSKVRALDIPTWKHALGWLSGAAGVQLPEDAIAHVAEKLHTTFPKALREVLKHDASKGGQAFSGMLLLLLGNITAALERADTRYTEIVNRLKSVATIQQVCQVMARVESGIRAELVEMKKAVDSLVDLLRPGLPLSSQFIALIEEKTKDFVGREYVFDEIEDFLKHEDKGYFIIEAEPGVGKSAILAKYVRNTGCVHHFNIQSGKQKQKPWLRPFTPSLTPPGTPLVRTLTGHSSYVKAVAITPDGQQVVSASFDNTLKVWDLESGTEIASFSGDGALYCCAVAPDGVTIVAGEASGRVHFLRLEGVARRG
jgi:WD40 repeat protein